MKEQGKQREKDLEQGKQRSQKELQLSAQETERWFYYPNKHERPEYAHERRCQDRSLNEFS